MTTDAISLDSSVSIPPQVMGRELGEETVILDLASGTYFGLDLVGTRTWQLLREGRKLREICDVLLSEYDVPRERLEEDLLNLLRELKTAGLIGTL